jgi:hypothetical protein
MASNPREASRHQCDDGPTAALRERSVAVLEAALAAYLGHADEDIQRDWRDVLVLLAPYRDCAVRLGEDPVAIFARASTGASEAARALASRVARRSDVTLEAFGWVLTEQPEGPCYEDANPITDEQLRASVERLGEMIRR